MKAQKTQENNRSVKDYLNQIEILRKAKIILYTFPKKGKKAMAEKPVKVTSGVSCIYVNKPADIDLEVLKEIFQVGRKMIGKMYPNLGNGGEI